MNGPYVAAQTNRTEKEILGDGVEGPESKSKRVSLKKKYKIIKKVKEHHKKKAKEAKKLLVNGKRKARKRKLGLLEDDEKSELADIASAEDNELAIKTTAKGISGSAKSHEKLSFTDHSERGFYKELVKVIEASDVVLEVLDARDPLAPAALIWKRWCYSLLVSHEMIVTCHSLSSDLVPREAVEKWLQYLREEFPAVAFKCSTQEQRSNLGWKAAKKAAKPSNILQTSDCLGAETLLKLLKNYSRSHELKKSITVGIVGLPNVGKSSLINSLKRSRAVNVGATPGLTKTMQEIQLDKNVKLLDCPGVVMLRASGNGTSVALRNCKRIEKLDDPVSPVKEILDLCPAERLMSLYKLPSFSTVDEFLQRVATVRGKLKKGGVVDVEAAARIVLHDWNEGKIPYYTFPPDRNQGETFEAAIVSELAKEFNVDEVYKTESSLLGALHPPRNLSMLRCHQVHH
ncbi:hypothetical protein QJS10_CPA01g01343 [Acorus calamus]|uniref:G domain-containing protein n=1 Tax=Acorus calamus TaxID=4465 RepID=A0AAV9FKF3_ACOCL|nr:hypothetical protein QJS10_CPA01g01343 [Acorus calamus]